VHETAYLALEDGCIFEGQAFGARIVRSGEVVFNTSLAGYQEIFTDPSYCGQIVVMTNPQIGNYGTCGDDDEAGRAWIEGLVVRELAERPSNFRSQESAGDYLARRGVPAISGIDTRAIVRKLRMGGVMRGVLSTTGGDPQELVEMARRSPSMAGLALAEKVSATQPYTWSDGLLRCSPSEIQRGRDDERFKVVAYDFGIKRNILRSLVQTGCRVTVVPATTKAEDVLALQPDGIFLSNGPGDPEPLTFQIEQVRKLLGRKPIFGICLGHQLLGLALGGHTYKLKFGHRGGNHPVLNRRTNKVEISVQNHGFCVDPASLNESEIDLTHVNLNDQTLEGLRHRALPAFGVQYHPEASPGPHDSQYLFDDFIQLMKEHQGAA
jgi:carbamoyl-phosphate synthase small subunit